jgi:N-methylhydantoinase B
MAQQPTLEARARTPADLGDYDVIGAEVHRKAIDEVARDMGITLVRTSGSPVVAEAKDLSCTVLDENGEQIGFAGFVAFHVATSELAVQAVLRLYEMDDIAPGDAFIANDPHTAGAIHQGDVGLVMPYYHAGEFVGWGYVNEHLLDVGGSAVSGFAPEARDCFSEALRFPGVRCMRGGKLSYDWMTFIATNVRAPGAVLNDLRSMVAGLNAGQRRLSGILDDYGREAHREFCRVNKALTERMIRSRTSELPDGVYRSKDWVEYDGHGTPDLYELGCEMTISNDDMSIRFYGVEQVPCFINGARPAVIGQAMTTLQTMFIPDVPVNAGLWRAIQFDLGPEGTIVNSVAPAPVTQAHMETGMRINRILSDVLSQAMSLSANPRLRSRVAGQPNNGVAACTLAGIDRRTGQPTVLFPIAVTVGIGGPAQSVADGLDTYSTNCNIGLRMPSVETEEATAPMMVLWREIQPSSGGAGHMRGGQGMASALVINGADEMSGTAFNSTAEVPPAGPGGGMPGGASHYHVVEQSGVADMLSQGVLPRPDNLTGRVRVMPAKTGTLTMRDDDVFWVEPGGGGGLGDPLLRPVEVVAHDVDDGWVTEQVGRDVYGVVMNSDGTADEAATAKQRMSIRAQRIGRTPARDVKGEGIEIGVSIAVEDAEWSCAYCGEHLGSVKGNYRSACVELTRSASEVLNGHGMKLRPRAAKPDVLLSEFYCPGCASCVRADIVVEGGGLREAPELTDAGLAIASRRHESEA